MNLPPLSEHRDPAPQDAPASGRDDTSQASAPSRFALFGHGRFGSAFAEQVLHAGHRLRAFDPAADVPGAYAADSMEQALEDAEWVVLAMPVPRIHEALTRLRPHLRPQHTVIDVGSVKVEPCAAMDQVLGDAVAHVGCHPLFGPLSLARGEKPLRTVICPSPRHPKAAERARHLFTDLGCEVITCTSSTHDQTMARTHAMAFFLAKALTDMGLGEGLDMATPSFRCLDSMLAAVRADAGHLFAAIQMENPFAANARSELIEHMQRIHRELMSADADGTPPSIEGLPGSID